MDYKVVIHEAIRARIYNPQKQIKTLAHGQYFYLLALADDLRTLDWSAVFKFPVLAYSEMYKITQT